jgi:hypothetical protein
MKEQCIKFCFRHGIVDQECMKCSKQLSVIMPYGENILLTGFLNSNVGKFQLKFLSIEDVPPQITQTKEVPLYNPRE